MSSSGRRARAPARASLCTCTPDSRVPLCPISISVPEPARSRPSWAVLRAGPGSMSCPRRTFSATVPDRIRGSCATYPIWWGRRKCSGSVIRTPFRSRTPVWWTRPASARNRDDLPGPTGSRRRAICPRSTVRSICRAPCLPSSWTAVSPRSSIRRRATRCPVGGSGAVPAARSTPGKSAEQARVPITAAARSIRTPAEGKRDTSWEVVRASHSTELRIGTATSAPPADRWSARSMSLSQSCPCATTSAGVREPTLRGPVCPCTRNRSIRSIRRTHQRTNQHRVQWNVAAGGTWQREHQCHDERRGGTGGPAGTVHQVRPQHDHE